mmetsp:Transcript_25329/g.59293  ORF Transcript_25329/g.59293 Transcript_25329/m.59293 type:complete len:98 (-) Transcript_25329:423-716(-)
MNGFYIKDECVSTADYKFKIFSNVRLFHLMRRAIFSYRFVLWAIRKKCFGLSNPSPEESAKSTISISSSSVMLSPRSEHTRCKSSKTTIPLFASSIN